MWKMELIKNELFPKLDEVLSKLSPIDPVNGGTGYYFGKVEFPNDLES